MPQYTSNLSTQSASQSIPVHNLKSHSPNTSGTQSTTQSNLNHCLDMIDICSITNERKEKIRV